MEDDLHNPDKPDGCQRDVAGLPKEMYRFAVQWCGQRAVLQFDFVSRTITLLQRGSVKHSQVFRDFKDFVIDDDYDRLCIQFLYRNVTVSIDDKADKEILDYLLKIIKTIILNRRANQSNFTGMVCQIFKCSRPLRILPQTVLKEGIVWKKGNGILARWEKRLLQVRLGEIAYFRVGEPHPLNINRTWGEECSLGGLDKNGFSLTVKSNSRIYYFRVLDENKTESEASKERWEWMDVLEKSLVSKYSVINAPLKLNNQAKLRKTGRFCSAVRQTVQRQRASRQASRLQDERRNPTTM